ncbi:MAG: hypothetical protein JWM97_569 [Phycisphaerales bacterium]|nr:hypothetical protein [Phycisphaerales bacterium]
MKVRLQQFGVEQSAYERPNQKWVCGRAAAGAPCHHGPDVSGRCHGGCECRPMQSGSRWTCTRSAAAGGPCDSGPLPDGSCCRPVRTCRPVRSLRARRAAVVAWTCALTLGLLLAGLGRNWQRFASPGPLSFAHGPILAAGDGGHAPPGAVRRPVAGNQGCGACHVAGQTGPTGWAAAATTSHPHHESGLCLDCHRADPAFHDRASAMQPHGLQRGALLPVTAHLSIASGTADFSLLPGALSPPAGQNGAIDCATCHHEHRGSAVRLSSMDNTSCQACHVAKFGSFRDDHPPFRTYPSAGPRAVAFDHARHRDQHFPKTESFQCGSCHTPSSDGSALQPPRFDAACARCHSEHFNGKSEPSRSGIVLFQLPALDLKSLEELKVEIGQWPRYDGDPPVRLSPFLRMLLSAGRPAYLDRLPPDLGQLHDASDEQIRAVQELAWAIKGLINEAAPANNANGLPAIRTRMESVLGAAPDAEQFNDLTAGLTSDDMREAARRWFPQLAQEVAAGHKAWDASTRAPRKPPGAPATMPAAPPSDDLFNDDKPAAKSAGPSSPTIKPSAGQDDDLFNGDIATAPKPSAPAVTAGTPPTPLTTRPATSPADDLLDGDTSPSPIAAGPATRPSQLPSTAAAPALVASKPFIAISGWERDDEKFALIYHPRGHANAFMRQWLDLLAHPVADAPSAVVAWRSQISGADAGDTCVKCHVSRQSAGAPSQLAWSSPPVESRGRGFVKFSHRPHLLESRLQDCTACHSLPDPAVAGNSAPGLSSFLPISKETCAACHAPRLASDSCLTCHNYHVVPAAFPVAARRPVVATGATSP